MEQLKLHPADLPHKLFQIAAIPRSILVADFERRKDTAQNYSNQLHALDRVINDPEVIDREKQRAHERLLDIMDQRWLSLKGQRRLIIANRISLPLPPKKYPSIKTGEEKQRKAVEKAKVEEYVRIHLPFENS